MKSPMRNLTIFPRGRRKAGRHRVMLVANAFIPGVGLLNHVINPAVTNNAVSKPQELEADLAAYKACLCMG
jgi:hypothetical protein